MDCFKYKIYGKDILVYRSIYTPVNSNMYVILSGKEAVVIDPNINEGLPKLFRSSGINHAYILLTHEHYDHTSGVVWLEKQIDTTVFCQRNCADTIATERGNNPALVAMVLADKDKRDGGNRYRDFRKDFIPYSIKVDKVFADEATFKIGELPFCAISTPGHCPGSVCYELLNQFIFTGDTLLKDIPVVTRLPESDAIIYNKVTKPYLQRLSKDTIIMPGHGDPFILKDTNNI